ncbi:hypothetical protein DFQ30_000489 [Apophysomyces sp. BC1015]|nr:hypothetical protein DFQ30_000489 [Apophysomyces sp. BC1015]KAG0176541.1 hypothetical protein DFQ29_005992 [Apophysomyces sp. BC1021]
MSSNNIPNLRFTETWQDTSIHYINIAANIVSIVSASVVLLILLAMRIYDPRFVDRVTLRLTAAVSITDLVSSIVLVSYSLNTDTGIGCQMIAFLIIWLTNQYLFLTTAIAFNLKWLFLQKRYYNPAFEKWYYILSILLSLLTGALPLSAQMLGYDTAQGLCWFTPSYTWKSQIWEYSTYIFPQIICSLYCTVVVGFVVFRLKRDAGQFEKPAPQETINGVVRRILMYPLTPVLTQTGFIVSEIYMYQTLTVSYELNVWGVLMKALPGFFNLVAFFIDPALTCAWKKLKKDLIQRYGDGNVSEKDEPLTPSPSLQSMDARSYKIYADHGALDFVHPQNRNSMIPLASSTDARPNRYMRWIVTRLWPCPARQEEEQQHIQSPSQTGQPQLQDHYLRVPGVVDPPKLTLHDPPTGENKKNGGRPEGLFDPLPVIIPERDSFPSSPPPAFTIPICFEELDEVVPWRVLEADEDEEDILTQSTLTGRKRGSHASERVDSWLELNEPASPSRVSQWFNKRSGSFESVREQLARSSKSLRRWRRQQEDQERSSLDDQRKSRIVSGLFDPTLQAVPECTQEDDESAQRANRLFEGF